MTRELPWPEIEKLVQELAWRDYWQQVWLSKGDAIFTDLKNPQSPVENQELPTAVNDAETGIRAIDEAINELYKTGYMHNHMRMYVASICCNLACSHWLMPAHWMYYHLLDGDLASNSLSWQWVAGAFANKKYYANQENINKFFYSTQRGTFLDVGYDEFERLSPVKTLKNKAPFELRTNLPELPRPQLETSKTTLIYNYYNLDPYWYKGEDVQRILLLEPYFFEKYPVSNNCLDFVMALTQNIKDIKVYIGDFADLLEQVGEEAIVYKEHPTATHYRGKMEARYWLTEVEGYYPSFFKFWNKAKKELKVK